MTIENIFEKLDGGKEIVGVLHFFMKETEQPWLGCSKAIIKKFDFEAIFDEDIPDDTYNEIDEISDLINKIGRVSFTAGQKIAQEIVNIVKIDADAVDFSRHEISEIANSFTGKNAGKKIEWYGRV